MEGTHSRSQENEHNHESLDKQSLDHDAISFKEDRNKSNHDFAEHDNDLPEVSLFPVAFKEEAKAKAVAVGIEA